MCGGRRSEVVTFFHLFFAASSDASNCDLRIGVAAAEMYPTRISDFESELFLQGGREP
jgi:hypothetical protein